MKYTRPLPFFRVSSGRPPLQQCRSYNSPPNPTFASTISTPAKLGSLRAYSSDTSEMAQIEASPAPAGTTGERTYAAGCRGTQDAITALNSFQSNFAALEALRKNPGYSNQKSMPEMIEWFRRAEYKPSDFTPLSILHVAGTKGKGSTCAFITSILRQYSLSPDYQFPRKIGTYTSPHLKAVRERIQINGHPISEALFTKYFFELYDRLEESGRREGLGGLSDGHKPMYFRFLTMLALHTYLREGCDTVILEVGVGGEHDSTNVVEAPTVTGITRLGIDHVGLLGHTLGSIAWHKAGIFKTGSKGMSVPQEEEAMKTINERVEEKKIDFEVVPVLKGIEKVKLGLAGEFQKGNASLAVKMVEEHIKRCTGKDIGVGTGETLPEEVKKGLETAVWKGRCQIIAEDGVEWCVDGAHTKDSIMEAGKWFASVDRSEYKNIVLLFNQQTRDAQQLAKDLNQILKDQLGGDIFTHVFFTTNRTYSDHTTKLDLISINISSEAVDTLKVQKGLAKAWPETGSTAEVHVMETIQETVEAIRKLEGKSQVLVTGSLHLVGGFLEVVEDGEDAAILPN
ncbi:Folylpolyglutamate synthetase [Orbilia blumenaviensis]|uniref:Folylpolyglutamate synthase n=1 Tax=Orbilia blumenaviensis TaxID=1796055 RepID=A0AAV9UUU5_9PEZI